MKKDKVTLRNEDGKPEPIVEELLALASEAENNPDAQPSAELLSAYRRGVAFGNKIFDTIKDPSGFTTADAVDNARVLFIAASRVSACTAMLLSTFYKKRDLPIMMATARAIDIIDKWDEQHGGEAGSV